MQGRIQIWIKAKGRKREGERVKFDKEKGRQEVRTAEERWMACVCGKVRRRKRGKERDREEKKEKAK